MEIDLEGPHGTEIHIRGFDDLGPPNRLGLAETAMSVLKSLEDDEYIVEPRINQKLNGADTDGD